jgi:hypothetical protein
MSEKVAAVRTRDGLSMDAFRDFVNDELLPKLLNNPPYAHLVERYVKNPEYNSRRGNGVEKDEGEGDVHDLVLERLMAAAAASQTAACCCRCHGCRYRRRARRG